MKKIIFTLFFSIIITLLSSYYFIINIDKSIINSIDIYNYSYMIYHTNHIIETNNYRNILDTHTNYNFNKYSALICDPTIILNSLVYIVYKYYKDNPNIILNSGIIIMNFLMSFISIYFGIKYKKSYILGLLFGFFIMQSVYRTTEYPRWQGYFFALLIPIIYFEIMILKNKINIKYFFLLTIFLILQFYSSIYFFFVSLHSILILFFFCLITKQFKNIKKIFFSLLITIIFIFPILFLTKKYITFSTFYWSIDEYSTLSNLIIDFNNYIKGSDFLFHSKDFFIRYLLQYIFLFFISILFFKKNIENLFLLSIILITILFNNSMIHNLFLIKLPGFKEFRNYFRTYHLLNICFAFISINSIDIFYKKINLSGKKILIILLSGFFLYNITFYNNVELNKKTHFILKTKNEMPDWINNFKNTKNKIFLFLPLHPAYDVYYLNFFMFFMDNYLVNGFTQHTLPIYDNFIKNFKNYPSTNSKKLIKQLKVNYIIQNNNIIKIH